MEYIEERENKALILDGKGIIDNQQKDETRMTFDIIENNSENIKIELPYIFYVGYNVKLNEEKIDLKESDNGFLQIEINDNKTGTVSIAYTGSTIMNITKIISIISFILFTIYCFKDKIYNIIKSKKERGIKVGEN